MIAFTDPINAVNFCLRTQMGTLPSLLLLFCFFLLLMREISFDISYRSAKDKLADPDSLSPSCK